VNQRIRELLERLSGYWQQLQAHQRRNLVIAGSVFVLTVVLLSWFAFRPHYVAVYSNLEPGTAGEIVAKLDEMKIPNRIEGTSVLVPEEQADKARVQLAMNNLPKSGNIDFGIFNQNSMIGMTEREIDIKYLMALEGSISNTIRSIKGVENAQVHIVMPEQKLFVTKDLQDAKASVLLKLSTGSKLSPEQVLGIQQLVAGSVKGLKAENITIVDQNGVRLLDENLAAGNQAPDALASKEMEVRKMIQQDFEKKIRNTLEKMFGYGNVEVIVNPKVSFDKVQRTDKQYAPPISGSDSGMVISEQKSSKTYENGTAAGGAAGNNTNNPNSQTKSQSGNTSSGEEQSSTKNYVLNESVIQTNGQAYKIESMSVSVLVNKQDIDNKMKQDITNLVATAIGNKNDGTSNADITVMGTAFQAQQILPQNSWYENPLVLGGIAAGLLLVGGGAYAIARRRKEADTETVGTVPAAAIQNIPEETSQQRIKKQLEKMINQKPDDFVNILRTWLAEE
jgi:flagellar M-ring protein FliF